MNMTNFRYILASAPTAFPIPMSLGICIPRICTVEDFNSFKPFIVPTINNILPHLIKGIKGFYVGYGSLVLREIPFSGL